MIDVCPVTPQTQAKLAYVVTDMDKHEGGLVFANSNEQALAIGAARYGYGEIEYFEARREPRADHLADTTQVPASFLVELGWRFECSGCGEQITEDDLLENDLTPDDVRGLQDSPIYCSSLCEARDALDQAERKKIEMRWVRKLRLYLKKRYPECTLPSNDGTSREGAYIVQKDGRYRLHEVFVEFTMPFSQHGRLKLKFQRNLPLGERFILTCPNGDVEAFGIYRMMQSANQRPQLQK